MKESENKRLKVLVEAYECSPVRGHAAGSAWQIISRLAHWHNLWVITEETHFKQEVVQYLTQHPDLAERLHFSFVPYSNLRRHAVYRAVLPVREVLHHRKWLRNSLRIAADLHKRVKFDVTHHLRRNSFREPGFFWQLPIPFVWGPTGSKSNLPWQALRTFGVRDRLLYAAKNLVDNVQFRFSRRVRMAACRAAFVIAQTSEAKREFSEIHGVDAIVGHEQAANPTSGTIRSYECNRPLSLAWAGQCIARKGLPVLLKAASNPLVRGKLFIHIAGDGPCRREWESLARRLGVADHCVWHGWLSQDATMRMLDSCDVLAFTSFGEGTPATVMQALSIGLPVICLNHCGQGDIVDESCGIVIPVRDIPSIVDDFTAAVLSLLKQPTKVEELSLGASKQASEYTWDSLVDKIRKAYELAVTIDRRKNLGNLCHENSHDQKPSLSGGFNDVSSASDQPV